MLPNWEKYRLLNTKVLLFSNSLKTISLDWAASYLQVFTFLNHLSVVLKSLSTKPKVAPSI